MKEITIKTQEQLDKLPKTFTEYTVIYIDSPADIWISVLARGSSCVVARGSSHVEARGSSCVVARGSSHVEAQDNSPVEPWVSSHVVARGSSPVEARGSSCVVARGSS